MNPRRHRLGMSVASVVLVSSPLAIGVASSSANAAAGATVFSSCAKLHRVWPNGVAKSQAAAAYQVRTGHYRPAYGPKARRVYWANYRGRDADRDGTACERTR